MGSIAKQFAKQQRRKQIKEMKKMFLDERRLHERLISEGTLDKSNLVGVSVRKVDWSKQLDEMTRLATKPEVSDDEIDLDWLEDEAPSEAVDTSHLHGIK